MKKISGLIAGLILALLIALGLGWPITAMAQSRQFSGAINGKLRIVMKLNFNGGSVSGSYYYEKIKTNIRLEGGIDDKGSLSLTEFDPKDGKISGTFVGRFVSDRRIEGQWIKGDGSKTLPFYVEEGGGGGNGAGGSSQFVGGYTRLPSGNSTLLIKSGGKWEFYHNYEDKKIDSGTYKVQGNRITLLGRGNSDSQSYVLCTRDGQAGLCEEGSGEFAYVKE